MPKLTAQAETWPLAQTFTIARGSKTAADVVTVTLADGDLIGRGECVPYPRYGESPSSVIAQIHAVAGDIEDGADKSALQTLLRPGAARFAIDAALWDLEAKRARQSVWNAMGIDTSTPLTSAFTISYSDAEKMGADAALSAHLPLLKIKLAREDDIERLRAVRAAAPEANLIVDANEGWSLKAFEAIVPALEDAKVVAVEQPLPAGQDGDLASGRYPFSLCADESCHDRASLDAILGHYDMINIKLDKTGGLTEALALKQAALAENLSIMSGCMVGTSLAMAPAMAIGHDATLVDLDGPLLLKEDRAGGIHFDGPHMHFPPADLWGGSA